MSKKKEKKKYYTFVMTMIPPWKNMKAAERLINTISQISGFHAVHPDYPYVMPVFETLEGAIRARDMAAELGEQVAKNIMNARVEEKTGTLIVLSPVWGPDAPKA